MFELRPVTDERAAKAGKADELEGDVGCSSLPHLTLENSERQTVGTGGLQSSSSLVIPMFLLMS